MKFNVLKRLGVGSVGEAYLLDDEKVLIVGTRSDSYSVYKTLFNKFKLVDGKINEIKYPKIYELIEPGDDFIFGAIVEEYVGGEELKKAIVKLNSEQKEAIGKKIAMFLKELHNIKVFGDKAKEIKTNLSKLDRSLGLIKEFVSSDTFDKLSQIKDFYKELMERKEFCITHGDLNAGNIMIGEDNILSGIIDFGNMEYYFPEIEFVHMYFFDRIIYDSMVANYNREIIEKEIVLLRLIVNIRHFKNICHLENKRKVCLIEIEKTLNLFMSM